MQMPMPARKNMGPKCGTRRVSTQSASRGTDLGTPSPLLLQSNTQPNLRSDLRSLSFLASPSAFPSLTQPSPKLVSKRTKKNLNPSLVQAPQPVLPIASPLASPPILPIHLCGVCNQDCDEGEVIGCEGECKQWFHIQCIEMDRDFFLESFVNVTDSTWSCQRCRRAIPSLPTPWK